MIQGHLTSLRRLALQLAHNQIDACGAHDLVQSIRCIPRLDRLTLALADNPCMAGDGRMRRFSAARPMPPCSPSSHTS